MSKKYSFPFTYPIENDINIHIEHIDKSIYCIWFSSRGRARESGVSGTYGAAEPYDNKNQEEQNIPSEFKLYNCSDKIVNPFRNTQSYAVSSNRNYTIKYNEKPILQLTTQTYLTCPPIIKNEIKVVIDNEDNDENDY